jgi:transcription initiation factor TFIID TATA-box-binding protein
VTAARVNLVNAVGGGDLHVELDLGELSEAINTPVCRYDPEYHPSLYIRFDEEGATILVFRTGKYNIAGANSVQELHEAHRKLINILSHLGIETSEAEGSFELRNLVFVEDLETEFDLTELTIGLGMEQAEYEPEQFPGVQFNQPGEQGLFLIFRTGKIILTGVNDQKAAESSFSMLRKRLKKISAI